MKRLRSKLWLVPLLLALAVLPLCAQESNSNNSTNSTAPASLAPSLAGNSDSNSNNAVAAAPPPAPKSQNAHKRDIDNEPSAAQVPEAPRAPRVRIDSQGNFMDGPHSAGGFGNGGPSGYAVIIAIGAILIPFVFLTGIVAIIFEARRKKNEQLHETLRLMIEKGVPIPPELVSPQQTDRRDARGKSDLRSGLVWIAIGFGVMVFLASIHAHEWLVGFVFILMGGAFLFTYKLDKKNADKGPVEPH